MDVKRIQALNTRLRYLTCRYFANVISINELKTS